jgi:predicted protein tyrosine phosphatase
MNNLQSLIKEINKRSFDEFINKIPILSKGGFKRVLEELSTSESNVEKLEDYVFISILNTDVIGDNVGYFKSNKSNVLILNFNDIEEDVEVSPGIFSRTISNNQSMEIIEFINRNKEIIINGKCVVHCSAGVSRSGAVGLFINNYFSFDEDLFRYFNSNIIPNKTVLDALIRLSPNVT